MVRSFVFLVVLLVIFSAGVIAAQDVTPEPTPVIVEPPPPDPVVELPDDPPATTPENLLGQLFALLKDGTFIAWAAAGVLVIVGLIKTLAGAAGIAIQGNTAVFITIVVQVLIWLFYATANYFGHGVGFQTTYLQLVDVLRSLLPLAGAIFAGHVAYQQAAKRGVPILGYKYKPKVKPGIPVELATGGEGRDWSKP